MKHKLLKTSLLSLLLVLSAGCATQGAVDSADQTGPLKPDAHLLVGIPETDCQIRLWYNYQVVAIPVINKRWQESGMTLVERAKAAFNLRHQARINARYMMASGAEELRARDQQKYGNPDGPTFAYLVNKAKGRGDSEDKIYTNIIDSSSRTDAAFNEECMK